MANRKKKRIEEQSDSAVSQIEDENHNNNHNKNFTGIDLASINTSKQLLLENSHIQDYTRK